MEKTANLGDAKSKTKKKAYEDLCRAMLQHGRGVAVQAAPETGLLDAYAEMCVELTAYNDMWGSYEDVVVVVVGKSFGVACILRFHSLYWIHARTFFDSIHSHPLSFIHSFIHSFILST